MIAALFLALVFIQHSDHVASWGRAADDDTGSFSVRTGAIGNTAVALGAGAIALAVLLPAAVPTMSMSVFEGNGPGTREVEVKDPMVDLRRDLSRGEDIPLLWVTTPGPKPTYLRYSVLANFNGTAWTPGDREIPSTQSATGALPALDGVAVSVPRREFKYNIRVGPDFDSTWLPTMPQVTQIAAGTDWRYDVSTRDFIAAQDDVTTAELNYDFTGVQLDLRRGVDELARSPAPARCPASSPTCPPVSTTRSGASRPASPPTRPTRFQKAQTLQQWFREDGGFRYDVGQVESAGSGGADLLAFLEDRVGYCEQFAASMAIMARVLGIPSRVAVGFLEPERSTNGSWEYSAHDMHAWPELYFPGSGWVRFEPTPPHRAGDVPDYTAAEFAPVPETSSPSPSRSTELLPERGQTPGAEEAAADEDGSSIPWGQIVLGVLVLALVVLLLLVPRLVRGARRRRRLDGGIEDIWDELRAVAVDLGHAWPSGRSPRRTGDWVGRLLARPASGTRPARPPPPGPRPGPRGRARTRPADDGARALALLPQPRVLHRRAVPRRCRSSSRSPSPPASAPVSYAVRPGGPRRSWVGACAAGPAPRSLQPSSTDLENARTVDEMVG